ncbi:MAG: hypothetical protein U0263_31410 [Polyangiaceae bacterium]
MLPALRSDPEQQFDSAEQALAFVDRQRLQFITGPLDEFSIDEEATLSYRGHSEATPLHRTPLSDVALWHLESAVKMPRPYAASLDPDMHVGILNDHLRRHLGAATVVVAIDVADETNRTVVAIVPGGQRGIDDRIVLQALKDRGIPAHVTMRSGSMDVKFGVPGGVEVLPEDVFELQGYFHNQRWNGGERGAAKPSFEAGAFALRLVCTNGAIVAREVASARLERWVSRREVEAVVARHVDRVLRYPDQELKRAVARMADDMPDETEAIRIRGVISRAVGEGRATELLANAVSFYDHANAITGAAHHTASVSRRRALQVEGGALFERFLRAA